MKKPGRREFLGGLCASALVGSVAKAGEAARLEKMFMSANETTAIVLGSAQDAGLPHVACQKAHCVASRADVSLRRRASCVAVLEPKSKSAFMFDATPDFPSQLNDIPLEYQKRRKPLAGIFLTHAHLGHYTGLMYLGRAAMNAERVPVYCSRQMAEFLQQNGPWSLLLKLNNIEINIVEPGKSYKIAKSINVKVISVRTGLSSQILLLLSLKGQRKNFFTCLI